MVFATESDTWRAPPGGGPTHQYLSPPLIPTGGGVSMRRAGPRKGKKLSESEVCIEVNIFNYWKECWGCEYILFQKQFNIPAELCAVGPLQPQYVNEGSTILCLICSQCLNCNSEREIFIELTPILPLLIIHNIYFIERWAEHVEHSTNTGNTWRFCIHSIHWQHYAVNKTPKHLIRNF